MTKAQIREKRGFLKEADKCSNCVHFEVKEKYTPAECKKDGFKIGGAAWCNEHKRIEG